MSKSIEEILLAAAGVACICAVGYGIATVIANKVSREKFQKSSELYALLQKVEKAALRTQDQMLIMAGQLLVVRMENAIQAAGKNDIDQNLFNALTKEALDFIKSVDAAAK